jgi:hypothetical protein
VAIEEGEIAWNTLDKKTRNTLKKEILEIYQSEEIETIEDVYMELNGKIPLDVIAIIVGELIDLGLVVEDDEMGMGEILAIIRQNRASIKKLEKKIDIIANGLSKIMRLFKKNEESDGEEK